ncbi:MAG: hypothetical protein NC816_00465 [Candidatus Omnitrophica bacterium]|nr:hypothetical protein [Candidatus Omnitrophota bacterium]
MGKLIFLTIFLYIKNLISLDEIDSFSKELIFEIVGGEYEQIFKNFYIPENYQETNLKNDKEAILEGLEFIINQLGEIKNFKGRRLGDRYNLKRKIFKIYLFIKIYYLEINKFVLYIHFHLIFLHINSSYFLFFSSKNFKIYLIVGILPIPKILSISQFNCSLLVGIKTSTFLLYHILLSIRILCPNPKEKIHCQNKDLVVN